MSRVGKQPVEVPSGVTVSINGTEVSVSGPKGQLKFNHGTGVTVVLDGSQVKVEPKGNDRQSRSNYGTTRSLINNMVIGVSTGYTKELELQGVGYTANLSGKKLTLNTGYSHETSFVVPDSVQCKVEKSIIKLESYDKIMIGQFAAKIRQVCPPEPYLGKGIRYVGEQVRRKAGKTGK